MLKRKLAGIIAVMCMMNFPVSVVGKADMQNLQYVQDNSVEISVFPENQANWAYFNYENVHEGDNGNAEADCQLGMFVLIADESGIDEQELQNAVLCEEIRELSPETVSIFLEDTDKGNRYFEVNIPDVNRITENGTEYIQGNAVRSNGIYSPELRKYISGNEHVKDVVWISCETTGTIEWNNDFTAKNIGIDEPPLNNAILTGYEESVSALNALKNELTGYAMLEKANETAAELQKANEENCYSVTANVKMTVAINSTDCQVKSAEEVAGDANMDNIVNAIDAAVILSESAKFGSTGKHLLTGEEFAAADMNNDNIVNALDAAMVLEKSAKTGAGIK